MRLVRRDVQPQHVVQCRRVPCACVPFDVRAVDHAPWRRNTARAVMSWSLVLCIHVRSGHTTQTSTQTRSLPVLREQFQPGALLLASRRNTNLTSTDCDVDPGTESECESCKASSENQVLFVAVITKAEGRRYSQMYRIP